MAALAETSIFRKKVSLGPIMMEIIHTDAGSDADTFTTVLQRPLFVMGFESVAGAPTLRATLVAATKTITVDQVVAADPTANYTVLVFGY